MLMNLRRHDLNLLVILEAILSEGSISRAAARLNLTQPAVSQALNRARGMFGDPLMMRDGRGLRPTARALILRDEIAALLERTREVIEGSGFDPQTSQRRFAISTADLGEFLVLPDALSRLHRESPACRIEVQPARHDLTQDMPDVALMGAPPPDGGWLVQDLYEDHFVLLARPGHPALRGALDVAGFAALPQALVAPRGGFSGMVDDALAQAGYARQVVLSLPRFAALPLVLARSDLVAAVPSRFAALPFVRALCAARRLPLAVPPFRMKLVWHVTRDSDAGGAWLRRLIAEAAVAGAG